MKFFFTSFLSLNLSLLLIVGFYGIGRNSLFIFGNNFKDHFNKTNYFIYYPIGISLVSFLIYPICLFVNSLFPIYIISFILIIFGLNELLFIYKIKINKIKISQLNIYDLYIYIFIFSYFLLSLAPITTADALDYHIGVPKYYLNFETWPYTPEWFHSRLVGNGEALITIGLILKAKQFPTLLQYFGFLTIIFIFINQLKKNSDELNFNNFFILTAILSMPVLIKLISTPKPFMLPISLILSSLYLVYNFYINKLKKDNTFYICLFFSILFLYIASQSKLNFLLSLLLFNVINLYFSYKYNYLKFFIVINVIFIITIFIPPLIWEYINYGGTLYELLFDPFPGSYFGYDLFKKDLTSFSESNIKFPFLLIFFNNLSGFTNIIGLPILSILLIVFLKKDIKNIFFILLLLYLIIGSILGQNTARFYIEPFLIFLFILSNSYFYNKYIYKFKYLTFLLLFQSFIVFAAINYGVFNLTSGLISEKSYENTMNNNATDYFIMKKINDFVRNKKYNIILENRSISLAEFNAISSDWTPYVIDNKFAANFYLNLIKKRKPTHILIKGDLFKSPFENCVLNKVYGPIVEKKASRNPFMKKKYIYEYRLFEVNIEKIPQCYNFNKS